MMIRMLGRRVLAGALLAAALVGISLPQTAFAANGAAIPSISYDAAANELTVGDGAGSSDLFAAFKGVVPGDTLSQDVAVRLDNVSAPTRLYVQALAPDMDDATRAALADVTLSASFDAAEGIVAEPQEGTPFSVFASGEPVLVASAERPVSTTLHLTLSVPVSVGNEVADLSAKVTWAITVEEEDDDAGDSTVVTPHADDLVAYEGGLGTEAHEGEDALPEPAWTGIDWESATVTVDNEPWDVASQGLPFRWSYALPGGADMGALVTDSAPRGLYSLRAVPLAGDPVVTVNGKALVLPADTVVTTEDGDDTIVEVRDVTADDAAEALATSHFKTVYGQEAPSLLRALQDALVDTAFAAGSSAIDGDFNGAGTHNGDCDSTEPHAHAAAGVGFVKNGRVDMPVNDGARIGLLWDDLLPNVLGSEAREGVLDGKARAAVGGFAAEDAEHADAVQHRFKYMDLVDMNDGNLWVATDDGSEVTMFVPYFEGIEPEDQIAVVYFEGLTRDYTVDMSAADLDAEIADARAHALKVTKAEDGILFNVPWCEFGPFELLWLDADATDGGQGGSGEEPGEGGVPAPGKPHTDLLPQTGDSTLLIVGGVAAGAAALLAVGFYLRRRKER